MRGLLLLAAVATLSIAASPDFLALHAHGSQHKHLMIVVEKGLPGATLYDADNARDRIESSIKRCRILDSFRNNGRISNYRLLVAEGLNVFALMRGPLW